MIGGGDDGGSEEVYEIPNLILNDIDALHLPIYLV
jgi:hypothetical protein